MGNAPSSDLKMDKKRRESGDTSPTGRIMKY
jgi:hypothetical protein